MKPQNILLDVDGHICLADFGLSKEVAGNGANLHTACGTPSYSVIHRERKSLIFMLFL